MAVMTPQCGVGQKKDWQIGEEGSAKKSDNDNGDDDHNDDDIGDDNNDDDDNGDDDNCDNYNDDDDRDGSDHYGWLGMRVRVSQGD